MDAATYVKREYDKLSKADTERVMNMTDDQIKANMYGHAMWDDPPDGWTEKELLLWSRGYLYGRSIQAISDAETLYMVGLYLPK